MDDRRRETTNAGHEHAQPVTRRAFLHGLAAAGLVGPFGASTDRAAGQRARQAGQTPSIDASRLNRLLTELSAFGRNADGGIDRVAYSQADLDARAWVMQRMREAALDVRIDAAGNIIGRRAGTQPALPPIMMGSHIDSVPGGGNYDGQVGSMAAIEVALTLNGARTQTRHPLEFVIFQNEENGKVGSRAMRGEDPAMYLDLGTHAGITIREGIQRIGGDPARLETARRAPGSIAAFLELHVEQGAVLDARGIQIGIVEGIVGIKRWAVTVQGFANHAGTTPMDRRQDAVLAAARFTDAVNRIAVAEPGRHVATVGTISAEPGAPNVIAGVARLTLEMRDLDLDRVDRLFASMRAESERIGTATGTTFSFDEIYRTLPARADERMQARIEEEATRLGFTTLRLPSGAGHDAQEIARLAPMGMIFVPSVDGISHSSREYSRPGDIARGAQLLVASVLRADRERERERLRGRDQGEGIRVEGGGGRGW